MNPSGYALVTGASSGIGECFARALGARKWNLVLVARTEQKLSALAKELGPAYGIEVASLSLDLSAPGAAGRLAATLDERQLEIGLLVNNAGFGARGRFHTLALDRQSEMLRLNTQALTELTCLVVPAMVAKRQGAIINVSSTASFQPVPYTAVYAASKAFVTSFSMSLAEELRPYGISVVTLCPGGTRTNFFEASHYGARKLPGGLQDPKEVVAEALKALDRGGGLVVPRLFNKFFLGIQRFVPRRWVARFSARIFREE
jgi:short-subunit dehydrogenase